MTVLVIVSTYKLLGLWIVDDLKWKTNTEYFVKEIVGEAEVQKYMFTYHTEEQFHFMFILYL